MWSHLHDRVDITKKSALHGPGCEAFDGDMILKTGSVELAAQICQSTVLIDDAQSISSRDQI